MVAAERALQDDGKARLFERVDIEACFFCFAK
jgi:hypothetical protein